MAGTCSQETPLTLWAQLEYAPIQSWLAPVLASIDDARDHFQASSPLPFSPRFSLNAMLFVTQTGQQNFGLSKHHDTPPLLLPNQTLQEASSQASAN